MLLYIYDAGTSQGPAGCSLTNLKRREPTMEILTSTPKHIELTDRQWENMKDLFDCRRKRKHSLRGILDAILYVIDNDINWRELPENYAPWQTVYYYFDKWRKMGIWDRVVELLPESLRAKATASLSPHYSVFDMHVIRTHRRPTPQPAPSPYSWISDNLLQSYEETQESRAA